MREQERSRVRGRACVYTKQHTPVWVLYAWLLVVNPMLPSAVWQCPGCVLSLMAQTLCWRGSREVWAYSRAAHSLNQGLLNETSGAQLTLRAMISSRGGPDITLIISYCFVRLKCGYECTAQRSTICSGCCACVRSAWCVSLGLGQPNQLLTAMCLCVTGCQLLDAFCPGVLQQPVEMRRCSLSVC